MTTFVDEAVVLRRVDYGEADRILTVLTREHGKIGVIARGVRKSKARMAGQTDMFSRSRMQLARGRGELLTLTQAEHVGPSAPVTDHMRAACGALIAELADRVLEENHPDEATFVLIADSLGDVLNGTRDPRIAVVWCARRMMDRLGYAPQLFKCLGCANELREEPAWFSPSGGGLLCPSCSRNDPSAIPCPVRVIKVLRCAEAGDADVYSRLKLDPETLTVLEDIVEHELAHHLDRRLKSLDVLRALRR